MNNFDNIDDTEELYRWILPNKLNDKTGPHYDISDSGDIIILNCAFLGGKKPSVDRAKFKCFDPKNSRRKNNLTDGVISITAEQVKSVIIENYTVNIEYKPLPNNKAHSQIVLCPKIKGLSKNSEKTALSDLRRGLAENAILRVKPVPFR